MSENIEELKKKLEKHRSWLLSHLKICDVCDNATDSNTRCDLGKMCFKKMKTFMNDIMAQQTTTSPYFL